MGRFGNCLTRDYKTFYKMYYNTEAVRFERTDHVLAWSPDYKSGRLSHSRTPPGGEMRVGGFEPPRRLLASRFRVYSGFQVSPHPHISLNSFSYFPFYLSRLLTAITSRLGRPQPLIVRGIKCIGL